MDVTIDHVIFHERTNELDVIFPKDGAAQVAAWLKSLEALLETAPDLPASDGFVIDVLFTHDHPPVARLHDGYTENHNKWELPDTAALPDFRLRGARVPLSVACHTPGGAVPRATAYPWLARLPPDISNAALSEAITARARDYVLPYIALAASDVDDGFVGVQEVGAILQRQSDTGHYDVASLYQNANFWRGLLEMAPGNPLVEAAPVVARIASGDLETSALQLQLYAAHSAKDSMVTRQLSELEAAYRRLDASREGLIRQGIQLEDRGDHAGAIAQYDKVLSETPCSAWAHYERGFSLRGQGLLSTPDDLRQQNKRITDCNPLYPVLLGAVGEQDTALLLWRLQLAGVHQSNGLLAEEVVRYADAALELGQPGVAGQFYLLAIRIERPHRPVKTLLEDLLLAATEAGATSFSDLFPDGGAMLRRATARRSARVAKGAPKSKTP